MIHAFIALLDRSIFLYQSNLKVNFSETDGEPESFGIARKTQESTAIFTRTHLGRLLGDPRGQSWFACQVERTVSPGATGNSQPSA